MGGCRCSTDPPTASNTWLTAPMPDMWTPNACASGSVKENPILNWLTSQPPHYSPPPNNEVIRPDVVGAHLVGHHGGITLQELLIPFLIA